MALLTNLGLNSSGNAASALKQAPGSQADFFPWLNMASTMSALYGHLDSKLTFFSCFGYLNN